MYFLFEFENLRMRMGTRARTSEGHWEDRGKRKGCFTSDSIFWALVSALQ